MKAVVAMQGPTTDMYKSRNEKTVGVKARIDRGSQKDEAEIDEACLSRKQTRDYCS